MTGPRRGKVLEGALEALYRASHVDQFVAVDQQTSEWHMRMLRVPGDPGVGRRPKIHRSSRHATSGSLEIALYRDVKNGRGATRLHVDDGQAVGDTQSWQELIDEGARRALGSVEPAWTLPRPAAPARVQVADPELSSAPARTVSELHRAVERALTERAVLGEPTTTVREVGVVARHTRVRVRTSDDFAHDYATTLIAVESTLASGTDQTGPGERIRRQVRRLADLDITDLAATGRARVRVRARAQRLAAGRYDVILVGDARTPVEVTVSALEVGDQMTRSESAVAAFGWFAPLVAHADARSARRGLTRYQPGQHILGTRPVRGDALTLVSDSTLPFGLHSRPLGDLGSPSRRFTLIERGVAAGLSLDLREAAMRGTSANGGIGNLELAPGPHSAEALLTPDSRPLLRVDSLDWLQVDARSGAFVAAIGVGFLLASTDATGGVVVHEPRPVGGGTMRGNIFDLFADVRLAAETDSSGWYYGPRWLRFGAMEIA